MRVVIAGASGIIGGRFIGYLLSSDGSREMTIRAVSRSPRDWPKGVEECVVRADDPGTLEKACREADVVVNLASMGERECSTDPAGALRVNAGGALALATAAARAGAARFVQVSTYKVYGNSPHGHLTEAVVPTPQSHYAITHRTAEDYARTQHPNAVIFRLAKGFGAPATANSARGWDTIVNGMCLQASRDRRIVVTSSGRSSRNFIPLGDVVRALRLAIADLPRGTYNLGWRESTTIGAMAKRIADVCKTTLGFLPEIQFGPPSPNEETRALEFDIAKLTALGFEPSRSLDPEIGLTLSAAKGIR